MPKKLTLEEFKKQLKKEHPNLELLSDYNGNKNYILVKCKIHDYTFKTKPNWLHAGHGCQKCYDERRGETTRKKLETFIKEANNVHNNFYDYSKTVYINCHKDVIITCPLHGDFKLKASKHLNGQGCQVCSKIKTAMNKRLKYDVFLERARKVHGDKYSYVESSFTTAENEMIIICPEHGEFKQSPFVHYSGCGCQICNESHLEQMIRLFLTEENIVFKSQVNKNVFNWLKRQSIDFYLPEYNIAIECQGKQHFLSVKHFGGDEELEKIKKRDFVKNKLLSENNIALYYIVDDNVDINNLPNDLYNETNTFHISEGKTKLMEKISKIKNILD